MAVSEWSKSVLTNPTIRSMMEVPSKPQRKVTKMSFLDVTYEEKEKFERTDLTPYRTVFDGLKPGIQATVVVPTGEINQDGPSKGKGKTAMTHDRAFRRVAQERNAGLQVGHNNMPDDRTRLTLMVQKKREFTPEAIKKRTEALAAARKRRADEKARLNLPAENKVPPKAPQQPPKAPAKAG